MTSTKEAMVIILDVGKNSLNKDKQTNETFIDKEKKCCIKLLQRKIFSAKKDEVALVLMGTTETENELNLSMNEGYNNICEAIPLSLPNWNMIRTIIKNVEHHGSNADWLDALIVAMGIIKREGAVKKCKNFKIVLFTTFSTYVNDDSVESVIQGLKSMDIELVVISNNVEYPEQSQPQPIDGQSQAVFSQKDGKSEHQRLSEELAFRIIEETDGNLCNFDFAIQHLMKFQRRKARPWCWYCTLEIGSEIKIQTSSMISVKEEQHFKWETQSGIENTKLFRTHEYYNNGEQITPDKEELIKGYMFGSTPIPFDQSLGVSKEPTQKGLKCIGFTPKSRINDEFMSGNGSYIVLPKKGCKPSEIMFAALVKAMIKVDYVMTAIKVHANGCKRKLVVLIPNTEREYPCLTMIEMYYADNYCHWFFPTLRTKKTESTPEQKAAIDKLIDAMDLTIINDDDVDDDNDEENVGVDKKELFPIKNLTHISLQHIYETVTKRALNPKQPVPTLDDRLAEALEIPSIIKDKSVDVIKEIKELFPLKEVKKSGKRELIRKLGDIPGQPNDKNSTSVSDTNKNDTKTNDVEQNLLIEVGTVTPAKDFLLLAARGENFEKISLQIRNVISDLIFKSMIDQNDKIIEAMATFREQAKLIGPWEYNDWIKDLKSQIITRKKIDFWNKYIVENDLGLISKSQSDLAVSITDEEAIEFYRIGNVGVTNDDTKMDEDDDVEDLFNEM